MQLKFNILIYIPKIVKLVVMEINKYRMRFDKDSKCVTHIDQEN